MRKPWSSLAQLALDLFSGPAPLACPLPAVLPTAGLRHAMLGGVQVPYQLVRARRKSIGFVIGPEGLVVRAPGWVALRDIELALQDKSGWILSKLQQRAQQERLPHAEAEAWKDGADLPYLGGTVRLCVVAKGQAPQVPEGVQPLVLQMPPQASLTQVREAAQAWFKQQARVLFEARLRHFGPQLGVQHQRLSLSSARTRWGSARSDGHIRLNWRLIHLPLAQIDYVVVHELAHLRVMDHSPRFWDTVGTVMPDYRQRRRALRALDL